MGDPKIYIEIETFVKSYDLNKDGIVTPPEIFRSFMKLLNDPQKASQATGVLVSTIDLNGDGKISYNEILKYSSDVARKKIEQNHEIGAMADVQAFLVRYDKDNNNKIDKKEFVEFFKQQGGYTPYSSRDRVLKSIDFDKDDCVSAEELQGWFKKCRMASGPRA
ncbi:hypothetical protein RB653_010502 [Dictyostelium firmibasis]|uniref:EF-hand domain-containing protein n=1 Tax=Dictyostelium firmibasis TaxID=79012 RepID=A0AAN7TT62_9MYCE